MKNTSRTSPLSLLAFAALSVFPFAEVTQAQGLFDPQSNGSDGALSFSIPPAGRSGASAVFDSTRSEMAVFGGDTGGSFFSNATLVFDGTGWATLNPVLRPLRRTGAGMAFDSSRNRVVLFGGFSGGAPGSRYNDTWEFDGTNWFLVNVANKPTARNAMAMDFDSTRNRVVMFGGFDTGISNETWEYDGTTWTLQTPAASPPGRTSSSMAFDAARGKMVLFGGDGRQDTWEYDGTTWTQISPLISPPGRTLHQMVYDAQLGRVLLFGGSTSGGVALNDIWSFDGAAWTALLPADVPPARSGQVMVYDTTRQRTVLTGGGSGATLFEDTWEFDGAEWALRGDINANPVLDVAGSQDGDEIFHYTTINVPAGVTVRFRLATPNVPPVWLASGAVRIDGSVILDGENGVDAQQPGVAAAGGPGGFPGGLGGTRLNVGGPVAGNPGAGPGGGDAGALQDADAGSAGYAVAGTGNTVGGIVYGNPLLNPLVAGSGGGGGGAGATVDGGKGGGGGGAILIASKESITIDGSLHANQGLGETVVAAGNGGDGSGGALRLVANTLEGSGTISAGPNGRVRLEAFFQNFVGTTGPLPVQAPPYPLDLATQGQLSIVSVAGVNVVNPGGNVNSPDVVFSTEAPATITVVVETDNIPVPSSVTLRVTSRGAALPLQSSNTAAAGGGKGQVSFTVAVPAGTGTIQAYADYTLP